MYLSTHFRRCVGSWAAGADHWRDVGEVRGLWFNLKEEGERERTSRLGFEKRFSRNTDIKGKVKST